MCLMSWATFSLESLRSPDDRQWWFCDLLGSTLGILCIGLSFLRILCVSPLLPAELYCDNSSYQLSLDTSWSPTGHFFISLASCSFLPSILRDATLELGWLGNSKGWYYIPFNPGKCTRPSIAKEIFVFLDCIFFFLASIIKLKPLRERKIKVILVITSRMLGWQWVVGAESSGGDRKDFWGKSQQCRVGKDPRYSSSHFRTPVWSWVKSN